MGIMCVLSYGNMMYLQEMMTYSKREHGACGNSLYGMSSFVSRFREKEDLRSVLQGKYFGWHLAAFHDCHSCGLFRGFKPGEIVVVWQWTVQRLQVLDSAR